MKSPHTNHDIPQSTDDIPRRTNDIFPMHWTIPPPRNALHARYTGWYSYKLVDPFIKDLNFELAMVCLYVMTICPSYSFHLSLRNSTRIENFTSRMSFGSTVMRKAYENSCNSMLVYFDSGETSFHTAVSNRFLLNFRRNCEWFSIVQAVHYRTTMHAMTSFYT